MIELDLGWLAAHPLPNLPTDTDKNERGRLLAVGGAIQVPGAMRLTGEAAFRAGAGKVQIATVEAAALTLGVGFPEAAVYGLAANAAGEIAITAGARIATLLEHSDALVIGPGMGPESDAAELLAALLEARPALPLLLDAAMLHAAPSLEEALHAHRGPKILTPHAGEMTALMNTANAAMDASLAEDAAQRFDAIVILKGATSYISAPGKQTLRYPGGGPGLATGGSGDVLAGIIGGLLSQRIEPCRAVAWGVWAHGMAGAQCALQVADIGFLARDLLPLIPKLLHRASRR